MSVSRDRLRWPFELLPNSDALGGRPRVIAQESAGWITNNVQSAVSTDLVAAHAFVFHRDALEITASSGTGNA